MSAQHIDFGPYHMVTFQDMVEHRPRMPVDEAGNIPIGLKPPFEKYEQATVKLEADTLQFSLRQRFGFFVVNEALDKITSQQTDGIHFQMAAGNLWRGMLDTDDELTSTDRYLFREGIGLYLSFILQKLPDSRRR